MPSPCFRRRHYCPDFKACSVLMPSPCFRRFTFIALISKTVLFLRNWIFSLNCSKLGWCLCFFVNSQQCYNTYVCQVEVWSSQKILFAGNVVYQSQLDAVRVEALLSVLFYVVCIIIEKASC